MLIQETSPPDTVTLGNSRIVGASVAAKAMRSGRKWTCGKIKSETDNGTCLSRHGSGENLHCRDCSIPATIREQGFPVGFARAVEPVSLPVADPAIPPVAQPARDIPAGDPEPVTKADEQPATKFPGWPKKRGAPTPPHSFYRDCEDCGRSVRVLFNGKCSTCAPIKQRKRLTRHFFTSFFQYSRGKSYEILAQLRDGNVQGALRKAEWYHEQLVRYGEELRAGQIVGEKK